MDMIKIKRPNKLNKKAIATSTIGYIILGIFALVIVLILIYGFLTGSLDVVGKIFGE